MNEILTRPMFEARLNSVRRRLVDESGDATKAHAVGNRVRLYKLTSPESYIVIDMIIVDFIVPPESADFFQIELACPLSTDAMSVFDYADMPFFYLTGMISVSALIGETEISAVAEREGIEKLVDLINADADRDETALSEQRKGKPKLVRVK